MIRSFFFSCTVFAAAWILSEYHAGYERGGREYTAAVREARTSITSAERGSPVKVSPGKERGVMKEGQERDGRVK